MECSLCWDEIPSELIITLGCAHRVCSMCLLKQVDIDISDNELPSLCFRCRAPINPDLIPNPAVKSLYTQTLTVLTKRRNPNLRPCLVVNCEGFRKRVGDSQCDLCGEYYCGTCGSGGGNHTHRYHLRKRGRVDSSPHMPMPTKPCFNCGMAVEKISGCNHMTCTRCNSDWCYVCGKPESAHVRRKWCV